MIKKNRILFLVGILFFAFFLLLADKIIFKPDSQIEKEYRYLSIFSEVVAQVKTNYVEEINPTEKFPGAFSAMLSSLDPFSAYLDVDKTKRYQAYQSGRYCDCGIYGAKIQNYFFITDVIPDSPADRAGLKHGDMIKAVNGKSLYSHSFWEMYLSLLSPEPQNIQLSLFKKNSRDTKKFELKTCFMNRQTTITPIQKDILLIKLTRFDAAAAALLKKQLTIYSANRVYSTNQDIKNKPLKLIIDLRSYSGGDLESFKQITRLFFKNKIALFLQQKKEKKAIFPGVEEKNIPEYKAVVIINSSTRLYGELFAAILRVPQRVQKKQEVETLSSKKEGPAVQEGLGRQVTLIGTATQGFIAQLIQVPLEDESSILLTDGLFQLNGNPTASKRIKPDIIIKNAEDYKRIMDNCISIFDHDTAPVNPVTEKK